METILSKIEKLMSENMKNIFKAKSQNNIQEIKKAEEILKTLKLIKAQLTKTNNTKEYSLSLDEEIKTLVKMIQQREISITEYKKGNRLDLVQEEENEIEIIKNITPQIKEYFNSMPTAQDIENYTKQCIMTLIAQKDENYKISMRDMGTLMPMVKQKYPNADGNIIKNTLQNYK